MPFSHTSSTTKVREGDYPENKHGWHMDPEELDKFYGLMDKFEG